MRAPTRSATAVLGHLPTPAEETADDLRYVYETNVFAVVRLTNAFLPLLRRAPAARIVNVTSKRGSIGDDGAWRPAGHVRPQLQDRT